MTSSLEKPNPVDGARERLAALLTQDERDGFGTPIKILASHADLTLLLADHAKLREALRVAAKHLTALCEGTDGTVNYSVSMAHRMAEQGMILARTALGDQ